MDDQRLQEVEFNKNIRGYVVRALVKGHQNTLLVKQISNSLIADGLILSPDIGKHLDYLCEAGYITFTDRAVTAYTAYKRDAVIRLTKKGVDLVEGTITDAGVDV